MSVVIRIYQFYEALGLKPNADIYMKQLLDYDVNTIPLEDSHTSQLTNKVPNLLDFSITKNIAVNYIKMEEVFDMTYDRFPIIMKECYPKLANN